MDAMIISVGTELTTGQLVDTNAAWLSKELTQAGVAVAKHVTVGDDLDRLRTEIRSAIERAELVVITGGLGPTPDDLTRDAIAQAIGQPLEEDAEALAGIQALFDRWQRPMADADRIQARIPRGCDVIPNQRGTAPGIRFSGEGFELFALPGVPPEMEAMFAVDLLPWVQHQTGGASTMRAGLRCFGVSEARIGTLLEDLMVAGRDPKVGTTAAHGVITVHVMARGADRQESEALAEADLELVRDRLGDAVFGEGNDTLESTVAGLLASRGLTLSTAESCTGGLLAKRLTDVPGSSKFMIQGYVTYSNESKVRLLGVAEELIEAHGAVSAAVAEAMASGCRVSAGTDLAISITGIAGPSGAVPPDKPIGTVFFGLADGKKAEVKRILVGDHLTRSEIRDRSASIALNLLRIRLLHPH